jgi:hypothetical protein
LPVPQFALDGYDSFGERRLCRFSQTMVSMLLEVLQRSLADDLRVPSRRANQQEFFSLAALNEQAGQGPRIVDPHPDPNV